ncbi:transcriptional regulator, TetR family [Spongiibacter sp. IMCC21906]|uniref:TetR/AcrR family transcriptional regulator n=1 Tax=Spongiibacter sp. IMCC21906 TaxID=1620392 RepID=UPI00062E033C|nr:TetR/AcrR family transcriptional regulator [Spongiibacter sp. IMCC21906]AKH67907.1 transcriptional regulator, TetR family [Spongiibacter sp. IMCC21906]
MELSAVLDNSDLQEKSDGKPRAKRMSAEARHHQILMCAIDVFADTGLINAKHTDVATRAKVSIPTVFHYFPTLEELQAAVLQEIHHHFMESLIGKVLYQNLPAYEKIERLLVSFGEAMEGRDKAYVTVWLEWSGFTRGFTWELYQNFYRDATSAIRKMLLQGRKDDSISSTINAVDASRVIMGMAHTIAHMRYSGSSQKVIQKTVHSLVLSYIAPNR